MNALERLENVTGIKRPEMDKIFQEVKANSAALNACSGHNFEVHTKYESGFVKKYKCSVCGCTADAIAVSWYRKGLEHGSKK